MKKWTPCPTIAMAVALGTASLSTVIGQIRLLEPPELASTFTGQFIAGSTAAFGTPYYGERLTGMLVYGVSKGEQHCRADDYDVPSNGTAALPNIVIVRRGNCNFVTKTRVAEKSKNAAAVIVVDYEGSTRSPADIQRTIMADDGWGEDVKIPSILITDTEGSKLINAIQNGTEIVVELAWDIPKDGTVSVDFWMTPASERATTFLEEYARYAHTLKHKLDFRPHYWIFSLPRDYKDLCLDGAATYCAFDPDVAGNVTGRDVVEESVRQMCLWERTAITPSAQAEKKSNNDVGRYSKIWWDYVQTQPKRCPVEGTSVDARLSKKCSLALMNDLGAPMKEVNACLERDQNNILERERLNHAWSPMAMRINDWRYSGPLDPEIVTRAVCAGFEERPEECTDLLNPSKVEFERQIEEIKQSQSNAGRSVPVWAIVVAVIVGLLIVIVFFIIYRLWVVRHLRRSLRYEVMNEVKQQMATGNNTNALNIHSVDEDEVRTTDTLENKSKSTDQYV